MTPANGKEIAWNGIRFVVPAAWEPGRIGARHLVIESEAGPVARSGPCLLATAYAQKDILAIHQGAMAEQFVGQELAAAGHKDLHDWARDAKSSSAEVDYLAPDFSTFIKANFSIYSPFKKEIIKINAPARTGTFSRNTERKAL